MITPEHNNNMNNNWAITADGKSHYVSPNLSIVIVLTRDILFLSKKCNYSFGHQTRTLVKRETTDDMTSSTAAADRFKPHFNCLTLLQFSHSFINDTSAP